MFRSLFCLLTLAATITFVAPGQAGHGCDGADGCGCHVQCPSCHHYCKLSVDKEKVKNYCWEVECKPVCVPRVHFPWECGCPPKCAKVIHVNVLKKKEYECEECKYTWTPEPEECCAAGLAPVAVTARAAAVAMRMRCRLCDECRGFCPDGSATTTGGVAVGAGARTSADRPTSLVVRVRQVENRRRHCQCDSSAPRRVKRLNS